MAVTPEQLANTMLRRAEHRRAEARARAESVRAAARGWARAARARGELEAAWLIGSLVKGTWSEGSDADVVVSGLTRADGATWDELTATLGCPVDLLRLEALPLDFAARVRAEGELLT